MFGGNIGGVVVTLEGGVRVKVKSNWWFRAGHAANRTKGAEGWKEREQERGGKQESSGEAPGTEIGSGGLEDGNKLGGDEQQHTDSE